MSVSRYEMSVDQYAESAINADWSSQFYEHDLTIDYSVPGNRLHRRIDGTLEVIPKPPGVVIGEQLLKPLIDTTCAVTVQTFQFVKDSFLWIDQILSKSINFLPGAAAQPTKPVSTLEICVSPNLQKAYEAAAVGLKNNDPRMLEAAHKLYGPFFEQCFKDETFHKTEEIHKKNQEVHRAHKAKYTETLKACTDTHGVSNCYPYNVIECSPDHFPVAAVRIVDGTSVPSIEWKTSQGYLSWSIYVRGWIKDGYYASDSYNYDTYSSKRTVPSRKEIEYPS